MTHDNTLRYFKNELNNKNTDELIEMCYKIVHFNTEETEEWAEYLESIENKRDFLKELFDGNNSTVAKFILIYCNVFSKGYSVRRCDDLKNADLYEKIMGCEEIGDKYKTIIKTSLFETEYHDVNYDKAEDLAKELINCENLPIESVKNLMFFYTYTRRYDTVEKLYKKYNTGNSLDQLVEDSRLRQTGKKKEYLPTKERLEKYVAFMNDVLNIPVCMPGYATNSSDNSGEHNRCNHAKIANEDYPEFKFVTKMNFDSFVAYDTETSGFSGTYDYITEIGAIKVVNGKVVDSEKFKFQELVHPYGKPKKIPADVVEVTGITDEMVNEARGVDKVFNDFADFIGDNILVGYNNKRFDAKMIKRAGRYAGRIITNKQFDLLPVAKKYTHEKDNELNTIAKSFKIKNPRAHRAYADAITTARIFFKLKELDEK